MDPETKQHYIELLEQWRRDEDNVKDQLEEVMKKLDKIITESKLTCYQNISLCAKFWKLVGWLETRENNGTERERPV